MSKSRTDYRRAGLALLVRLRFGETCSGCGTKNDESVDVLSFWHPNDKRKAGGVINTLISRGAAEERIERVIKTECVPICGECFYRAKRVAESFFPAKSPSLSSGANLKFKITSRTEDATMTAPNGPFLVQVEADGTTEISRVPNAKFCARCAPLVEALLPPREIFRIPAKAEGGTADENPTLRRQTTGDGER